MTGWVDGVYSKYHCDAVVPINPNYETGKCNKPAKLRKFGDNNVALCDDCYSLLRESEPPHPENETDAKLEGNEMTLNEMLQKIEDHLINNHSWSPSRAGKYITALREDLDSIEEHDFICSVCSKEETKE